MSAFCGGVVLILFLAFPANASTTLSFSRDAAGRLTGVNYGGASNTVFAYDADGNLFARTSTVNVLLPFVGTYSGRVTGGAPTVTNTGTIALTVSSTGAFTGTLTLDGVKYAIKGSFDQTGHLILPIVIPRKAPLASITLDLTPDLNGWGMITGSLSGGETSSLEASLAPFNKTTFPVPGGLVGSYTALFQPTVTGTTVPQGNGYGTVIVGVTGSVSFAGALADGTKATQGALLTQGAVWPLFIGLYLNGGFISGDVTFEDIPGTSDFDGSATWIKPGTAGPVYGGMFNTTVTVLGSKYTPPATNHCVLAFSNTSPNAVFTATGGNLSSSSLTESITLSPANKVSGPLVDPHKLKLTIITSSGLFFGSFLDGAATRACNGVIFQKQNFGAGYFLGTSESGPVTLESQ